MREFSREVDLHVQKLRLQAPSICSALVDGAEVPAEIVRFEGQAAVRLVAEHHVVITSGPVER